MAWTVEHNTTDITEYCVLNNLRVSAAAVSGGRALNLKIIPGASSFAPTRGAEILIKDGDGIIRFRGRIENIDRNDLSPVAGVNNLHSYDIVVQDIAALMGQRTIPAAGGTTAREARRLPPRALSPNYNGTFAPLASTVREVPIESALDWALNLMNNTETANNTAGLGRIIPAFQVGTVSGAGLADPDLRGPGHVPVDIVRFPPVGIGTYSSSDITSSPNFAADGSDVTYWDSGSSANPYWKVTFSSPQVVTAVKVKVASAWTKLRIELLDISGNVIGKTKSSAGSSYTYVGGTSSGATLFKLWRGDVPEVYGIRIKEAAGGSPNRRLYRVSAYNTYAIYQSKQRKIADRVGNPAIADTFTYAEVINNICERAQLGWYVDPSDPTGPILTTYDLVSPSFAEYEIGDDPDQTAITGGYEVKMARDIALSENSMAIVNRVTAQYPAPRGTGVLDIVVPDHPETRTGLAAAARASQTAYGLREKRLGEQAVTNKKDALISAQRELAKALQPEISGTVTLPYDADIVPGYRVRIHRGQHLPASSPKSYYVAVGFIKEVSWVFDELGNDPRWSELTIGDPAGQPLGFVEGVVSKFGAVAKSAAKAASAAASSSAGSDGEVGGEVPWGTYSTYVQGYPYTAQYKAYHRPGYTSGGGQSGNASDTYQYQGLVDTVFAPASWLPPIKGAQQDAYGRKSLGPGSWPLEAWWVPPLVTGEIIRARLFMPADIKTSAPSSDRVSELTARIWKTDFIPFYAPAGGYEDGWRLFSGGRDDLKSGRYVSIPYSPETLARVEFELPWPTTALTGAVGGGAAAVAVGPSALSDYSLPIVSSPDFSGTSNTIALYPGINCSRGTSLFGSSTLYNPPLWNPADPTALTGFDPRDPDENENGVYIMFMVNTGAPVSATPGTHVERELTIQSDRVKTISLGQAFEPNSLVVFVNGVSCSEDNGRLQLTYSGDDATGFDVSLGNSPIRRGGLRYYTDNNGRLHRDRVIARYRVV